MTEEERYLEGFDSNKLTQDEIENDLKKTDIKTTFDKLLQKGFIRATGEYFGGEQAYAPNKPSWIATNYPMSRLEAHNSGANYKMPLRLESVFYKYLKGTLKWSDKDILHYWNSRNARHFADNIQGSYWRWKTADSFLKYISGKSLELKRSLVELKREKGGFDAEIYYQGAKFRSAMSLISQVSHGETNITDPGTLKYLAKYKTEFIKYAMKNTFML